jgi:hypothetical protein
MDAGQLSHAAGQHLPTPDDIAEQQSAESFELSLLNAPDPRNHFEPSVQGKALPPALEHDNGEAISTIDYQSHSQAASFNVPAAGDVGVIDRPERRYALIEDFPHSRGTFRIIILVPWTAVDSTRLCCTVSLVEVIMLIGENPQNGCVLTGIRSIMTYTGDKDEPMVTLGDAQAQYLRAPDDWTSPGAVPPSDSKRFAQLSIAKWETTRPFLFHVVGAKMWISTSVLIIVCIRKHVSGWAQRDLFVL